jgi:O-methyltransferase
MEISRMDDAKKLYLDLMKKCLTFYIWAGKSPFLDVPIPEQWHKRFLLNALRKILSIKKLHLAIKSRFEPKEREEGRDWPLMADTMIGLKRLDNLQACIEDVISNNVPGDLIETGAWRGGATIFMRAALKAYGITDRTVWVADSFKGLPAPEPELYPADAELELHKHDFLRVSLEEVKANFSKYGLLDEQVSFLNGWFKDTLPEAPIEKLAIMRLDGDMYQSTMDAFVNLYPKLSVGGYVIIDDYNSVEACRQAVQDFRESNSITEEIQKIDWTGTYWQRTR